MTLPADKQALKRATRSLVQAVGGNEAAIGFCRMKRHQSLSEYASVAGDHAGAWMPLDVVADLEGVTAGVAGAPHVTRELARQAGFVLVPLPTAHGAGSEDFSLHLANIIRESADVTTKLSKHLADPAGFLPAAIGGLRREICEALQALVELDAALEASGE